MARYLLKFTKTGNLRFISHLDVLRLFQRAFKRAEIKLNYSQGFNPHAKIGFAHPLSLGFESRAEYMDFETAFDNDTAELLEKLNGQMPEGMSLTECTSLKETGRTAAAAAVTHADYRIVCRSAADEEEAAVWSERERVKRALDSFLGQGSIITTKYSKKKRRDVETDIRPSIISFEQSEGTDSPELRMRLLTGSNGNLNPQVLMTEFAKYAGKRFHPQNWIFVREEIYFTDRSGEVRPLNEFEG